MPSTLMKPCVAYNIVAYHLQWENTCKTHPPRRQIQQQGWLLSPALHTTAVISSSAPAASTQRSLALFSLAAVWKAKGPKDAKGLDFPK